MSWPLQLLGKPWVKGAEGPEAFDCWGLVRYVHRQFLGQVLPPVPVDADKPLALRRAIAAEAATGPWVEVDPDELQEGDVVMLSQAREPDHVGVWLAAGGVLHCVRKAGVLYQSLGSLKRNGWNLGACYRFRGGD
jgi:cell wall-associated NlpC family hydrolase